MPPSSPDHLRLQWMPGRYAVCRLEADAAVPVWTDRSPSLLSVTRTERELSIIIDESQLPKEAQPGIRIERGFVALRVAGTLDFNLVGVLAKLTGALAGAGVPVFVLSTFETDYLLIKDVDRERAAGALRQVATID